MSDEEVIRRRLQIDGDGTGDDRRLNDLLKTFVKWCNSNDSSENNQAIHDRLLAQLAQCEFAMKKSDFTAKMMQQELKNYATISDTIETGIETAKVQIIQSKESLVLAKKIRKNRMEYDVLAKIINQQPDRKNTIKELEMLKDELDRLQEKKASLERKLDTKKKDFTVLMRSIVELQNKLESVGDDNQETGEERMSCDDEPVILTVDDAACFDNDELILSSPEKN
ncbi:THO complex subunit 7 homolog [Toxorhynchites rutilus septentrionalis]|uniref:THO complex subunit 7 homolog n=1 Tax=Toxorhynchites rutilus septentrionalis TaxID=329112 RepID=UPI002478DCD0|nr:THO complex subunit 7 homolog [Toxorhynchites rutilus septentrionalis]